MSLTSDVPGLLPSPAPGVIARDMADGAVLFRAISETYFGLNAVGAQVWALLPPANRTAEEVCAELCSRYPDVPPQQIGSDVMSLLAALREAELVVELERSP